MIRICNGYRNQLPDDLSALSEDPRYQDTLVFCQDGVVRASRFILALALPILRRPLKDREEEEVVIFMKNFVGNEIREAMAKVFKASGVTYKKTEVKAGQNEGTAAKLGSKKEEEDFKTKDEEFLQIKHEVDSDNEPGKLDQDYGWDGWEIPENELKSIKQQQSNWYADTNHQDDYHDNEEDFEEEEEEEDDWKAEKAKPKVSKSPKKTNPNRIRYDVKDNAEINWHCHICDKPFATKAEYKEHETATHVKDGMIFCPYENCNKQYRVTETRYGQSRLIVRHIERHKEKERTKEYVCSECGKTFKNKRSLLPHMQIHRGIKDVPCDVCGQMFYSKTFLWSHKVQSKCGAEEVVCPTCGKKCKNKYYLKRHLMHHTGERPYKCDWEGCGKGFLDSQTLQSHRKIHLDIKEFQCSLCPKAFRQSYALVIHMKRHNGVRLGTRPFPKTPLFILLFADQGASLSRVRKGFCGARGGEELQTQHEIVSREIKMIHHGDQRKTIYSSLRCLNVLQII